MSAAPDFTIRSTPQMLPQPGLEGVGIVYKLDAVRSLDYGTPATVGAAKADHHRRAREAEEVNALPDDETRVAALAAWEARRAASYRTWCNTLIDLYVLEVSPWPYASPPPDPQVPSDWETWPIVVLDYITSDPALAKAREGLDSFLAPRLSIMPDNLETAQP